MKDDLLRDKIVSYTMKVEMPHRLKPATTESSIRDHLYKTSFRRVGNDFTGIVDLSGLWGSKLVSKKVHVTLKVNDKRERILVIPSLSERSKKRQWKRVLK